MRVIIVGGGIGGLATALYLHRSGIECDVYERSGGIRELGVGINTLPHAIKELAELGLLDELDRVGIRTKELIYQNRFGQTVWQEPRGTDAGYDFPQFSIHRGKLQGVLHQAVCDRIGENRVHTSHELVDFREADERVTATFQFRDGDGGTVETEGDILVGADGIHSFVRKRFYPKEGPPSWNGIMLWRGAVEREPFLSGRSMIIAGGMSAKFVLYPISNETEDEGHQLINWAVAVKLGDGSAPPPRREDWNRTGNLDELLGHVRGLFRLDVLDPIELIRSTPEFFEYPMCDRDPLPRWTFGRVTLLGDAAHPMYPVGSNGASQAILDARCLSDMLEERPSAWEALQYYESERLPATTEIVRQNRGGGPERVIDVIEQRAPDGFSSIDDVASQTELEAIVRGYSQLAGFDREQVNR